MTSAGWSRAGRPCRPLDRFYTRLNNETGLVEIGPRLLGQQPSSQRFSPRFPGEPIDGIGQFLYPAQFAGPSEALAPVTRSLIT